MKATSFLLGSPAASPAVAGLAGVLAKCNRATDAAGTRSPGWFERLDRWFWRQQMRDREAYLSGAQDIFELEERMRRLERSVGSRYY
jgi:hypothetical protein